MDHRAKLVAAALLVLSGSGHAYVSPSPPPGFGGSAGSWSYTPPTAGQQLGSIMRGPGPSVAGSGPIGAAYRLGPGAARALAKGVLGGGIPGALLLGGLWLASNCFEKQGAQWVRTCGGTPPPQSDGSQYGIGVAPNPVTGWHASRDAACQAWIAQYPLPPNGATHFVFISSSGSCQFGARDDQNVNKGNYNNAYITRTAPNCPAGWYVTPAGCVQNMPPQFVTPQQVEDEMAEKPLPSQLPPGVPYPLDPVLPSIWNPTETNPPTTQPLRVPQGNPVPIPNTNPQQYRQPMYRVQHSPTADDPWRMDVQPEDVVGESPTGQVGPQTVTSGSPPGTPKEETPDLCEKNPDIVACQKLGTLDALPVPNENKQLAINKDTGWQEMGTCPPAKTAHVLGMTLTFPWTTFCDFATMIRPLLIGFAWLSAALTFFGLGRKD